MYVYREIHCYPINNTTNSTSHSIRWIDSLLETPIEDHTIYAMWRNLAPYIINIRKVLFDEASDILEDWLNRCSKKRSLDYCVDHNINDNLQSAIKVGNQYLPDSLNDRKVDNPGLYSFMSNRIKNAK